MNQIIISVDTQGTPKIETKGYSGGDCIKAAAGILAALGQIESAKPTDEYYQEAYGANQVHN